MAESLFPPSEASELSLRPPDDGVHVWHVGLNELVPLASRLAVLLNEEERNRAARFHFEPDRTAFCLARGVLRCLLASYGVAAARDIGFTYSTRGKPALAPGQGCQGLQFNLSHAREMAVVALVRSRRIGVDVEYLRALPDADELVARNFAAEEITAYRALPETDRQQAFFNGWTRKEAFIKAVGEGLHYPLQGFAVTLAPGEPARLLRLSAQPGALSGWLLADVSLHPSYVAAVAVEGTGLQIHNRIGSPVRWLPQ